MVTEGEKNKTESRCARKKHESYPGVTVCNAAEKVHCEIKAAEEKEGSEFEYKENRDRKQAQLRH